MLLRDEDCRQLCTFWIDEILLAVDVSAVQEVVSSMEETPVPLSHQAIRALINLRGQVVPVVELRVCLNLPVPDASAIYVVLREQEELFSLRVDRMNGVIEVPKSCFETAPERVFNAQAELISGAYTLESGLALELDLTQIVGMLCDKKAA